MFRKGKWMLVAAITAAVMLFAPLFPAHGWNVKRSAESLCIPGGEASVSVSFTNKEGERGIDVEAIDRQSGKSVDLGSVSPGQKVTGTILTSLQALEAGQVAFVMTWTSDNPGTPTPTADPPTATVQATEETPTGEPTLEPTVEVSTPEATEASPEEPTLEPTVEVSTPEATEASPEVQASPNTRFVMVAYAGGGVETVYADYKAVDCSPAPTATFTPTATPTETATPTATATEVTYEWDTDEIIGCAAINASIHNLNDRTFAAHGWREINGVKVEESVHTWTVPSGDWANEGYNPSGQSGHFRVVVQILDDDGGVLIEHSIGGDLDCEPELTATPTVTATPTEEPCVDDGLYGSLDYGGNHLSGLPVTGEVWNPSANACEDVAYLHVFGSMQLEPEGPGWLESQEYVGSFTIAVPEGNQHVEINESFDLSGYCWYQADLAETAEVRVPPYYPNLIDYVFVKGNPACEPEPSPTPTLTATPTKEPPGEEVEVTAAAPGICQEADVRLELSNDHVWRFWMNESENSITSELLLTNDRLKDATSSSQSIDPSGCWYVASVTMPGENQSDLWIVSTSGEEFGIRRITHTDVNEANPHWGEDGVIRYSVEGEIWQNNAEGTNPKDLGIKGDYPVADPLAEWVAYVISDTIALYPTSDASVTITTTIAAEGPIDWNPDGTSITFQRKAETCQLDLTSNLASPTITCIAWDNLAFDPRKDPQVDVVEVKQELQVIERSAAKNETQLFAAQATQVATALAVPQELNPNLPRTNPVWWHEQVDRERFDSTIVENFFESAAAEAEAFAAPQASVCSDYAGVSVVDCLKEAGMNSSFEARAKLAVEHGVINAVEEYVGSVTQNIALLNLLTGGK